MFSKFPTLFIVQEEILAVEHGMMAHLVLSNGMEHNGDITDDFNQAEKDLDQLKALFLHKK